MKIMVNGRITEAEDPAICAGDRGLLLGDGLFETLRVDDGCIHFFKEHVTRLKNSAAFFSIPWLWSHDDLTSMALTLLKENRLSSASLRLTLTRGQGPRGVLPPDHLHPTLLVTTQPLPSIPKQYTAVLINDLRRNETSPTSYHKTLNYMDSILSATVAKQHGADIALLQNTKNNLACAHAANIFLRIDGQLFTPKITDGALPGIIRASIIKKQSVICEHLSCALLTEADEIFVTNSLCEAVPVTYTGLKINALPIAHHNLEQ